MQAIRNKALEGFKYIVEMSELHNKWAPILSLVSTIACLIIGILAVRYQINKMVYGTIGISLSFLHLINTCLQPKILKDPTEGQPPPPEGEANRMERYRQSSTNKDRMIGRSIMLLAQGIQKVYALFTLILMSVLYSLTMSGHIYLSTMGIITLTFTSLTFCNILSIASYLRPNRNELYEDGGANLWKPWKYVC